MKKGLLLLLSFILMLACGLKAQSTTEKSSNNVIANDVAYGSNSLHYAIVPVQQLGVVSFVIITQKPDMLQWRISDASGKVINTAPLQSSAKLAFADVAAGTFSEEKNYKWQITNASGSTIATINFTGKNCIPNTTVQDN